MKRVALVAVDSGVAVVGSRGHLSAPSPGLALIDGDALLVGDEAQRNARLRPRRVHSRFWQLLSTQPLERPFPHHLRTADLAHAQVSALWKRDGADAEEVILVVPGVFTKEQLALMLGIAGAADIPVRGLVDLGVAAAADRDIRGRCFHLDLHLHRAVLTELESGKNVVRGRVWENDNIGLAGLRDLWARGVARIFVRQTRFDPLHLAVTEQILYLALPHHIEALAEGETTRVTIASGGRKHVLDLERREMVNITRDATQLVSAWVRSAANLDQSTLLVSHHMASAPGLVDHLRETTDCEIAVLHPAAAGSAALHHAEHIVTRDEALPLVTRLPGYDARPPGPVTVPVTPPPATTPGAAGPTHLVVDGRAQAITEEPTIIPLDGSPDSNGGGDSPHPPVTIRRIGTSVVVEAPPGVAVVVNGRAAESSAALAAGDRLHLGEPPREVILVTMVS